MRKILSLITLLVTAVTAFAQQTFTGTEAVTVGYFPESTFDGKNLVVEDNGDGTYSVTFVEVQNTASNVTDTYGDFKFDGLTATTNGDVTTLTGNNLETAIPNAGTSSVIPAGSTIKEAVLTVKFNAEKAYASLESFMFYTSWLGEKFQKFNITFGTDDFEAGGGNGGEVGGGDGGETPATNQKLVDDGYAPNGATFAKPFTVNWDTHKLVANVDLTNCADQPNECIFSVSTNEADLANWDQESGSTLHLFYTKNASVWTASGWETYVKKFAVQYRTVGDNGAVNHYKEVEDPSNVVIEMTKDGLSMDGELVFPASEMANLYAEGDNALYFGSVRAEHTYCTYKSVELVPTSSVEPGNPDPDQPTATTYEYTGKAMTQYLAGGSQNVEAQYMKDAKIELVDNGDDTYTATFKDVVVGNDSRLFGDIVLSGLTYQQGEDLDPSGYAYTSETVTVNGTEYTVGQCGIEIALEGETPADNRLFVQLLLVDMTDGSMVAYQFDDDLFIPVVNEFTSEAHVTANGATTDLADAKVVLTEFMEDVYRVTFKNLTLGDKTGDFSIDNLEATVDEENNVTFTTDETYGEWNDEDMSESTFSDFTLTATKTEEGFANLVLKFTAEGANVVFGEAVETPEQPEVEEYHVNFDKNATQNHASRYTTSISLQQVGKEKQTVELNNSKSAYEDHSAEKFTVDAGSEVQASFGYNGEWMHGYLYIDLDNNKQFDVTESNYNADGSELVAFSFFGDPNESNNYTGANSKGETVKYDCNVALPTFTAPTTPGTYRMRYKIDWNSVDPGGCVASTNHILNNGGGIWDVTLEVTEPVVDAINGVSVFGAEAEYFTVDGVKLSKLQKGLNIVRTADGKVKKVVVK